VTRNVYLDYAATTPVDPRVFDAMSPFLKDQYGNPSSLHSVGREAARALDDARESIAAEVGAAEPSEIIFTAGGTEADNTAVLGIAKAVRRDTGRSHLVVSAFEHNGVLTPAERLAKEGFELTLVKPGADGIVSAEALRGAIRDDTALVSVMHVNNELGTIQPLFELAQITHENEALFHTDAVQSMGKIDFDAVGLEVDAASFSAHKIYGPKGTGALYLKRSTPIQPLLIGGGQESKKRGGTENVAGIVGMAEALKIMIAERPAEEPRLKAMRDKIIDGILDTIENTVLNGDRDFLVPHVANFIIKGVEGESMLLQLDHKGIMVSTGSACSSSSLEPSHVLLAIGCPPELAHGSLRVSIGRFVTDEDIEYFLTEFPPIVHRLREMSPTYEKMYANT